MTDRNTSPELDSPVSAASGALRNADIEEARVTLRQAQTALVALGYQVGDGGDPGQGVDGVWGELTQEAVLAFQSDRGLSRTGQLDPGTLAALLDTEMDALDIESSQTGDEMAEREAAEHLLHSGDRESLHEVLDGMQPTDTEEDMLT